MSRSKNRIDRKKEKAAFSSMLGGERSVMDHEEISDVVDATTPHPEYEPEDYFLSAYLASIELIGRYEVLRSEEGYALLVEKLGPIKAQNHIGACFQLPTLPRSPRGRVPLEEITVLTDLEGRRTDDVLLGNFDGSSYRADPYGASHQDEHAATRMGR